MEHSPNHNYPPRWKKDEKMEAIKDMHVSPLGVELIKGYEKCELRAYADSGGVYTIAWGNTFYTDGRRVKKGDTITKAQADELFKLVLPKFELAVKEKIKRNLLQQEFDSAVCFAYNAGVAYKSGGKWKDYNLWHNINTGLTGDAMRNYWQTLATTAGGVQLKGLVRRRKSEVHMYLTGELDFFE